MSLEEIRECSIFCLVYSPKENQLNPNNEEFFQNFANKICNEARERFPYFGLKRFKKFLFGDVFLLAKDEFLEKFQIQEDMYKVDNG